MMIDGRLDCRLIVDLIARCHYTRIYRLHDLFGEHVLGDAFSHFDGDNDMKLAAALTRILLLLP